MHSSHAALAHESALHFAGVAAVSHIRGRRKQVVFGINVGVSGTVRVQLLHLKRVKWEILGKIARNLS